VNGSCRRCAAPLEKGALVCRRCHGLVHAETVEHLVTNARLLESKRDTTAARTHWLEALALLPAESSQAAWILERANRLDAVESLPAAGKKKKNWILRLGPLAPIAALLTKGKAIAALLNLKFLLSFVAFFGVYWSIYGVWFGLGFTVQILAHELGHYIDIKRRGLPADMPVFLPGLGAFVRWQALGVSAKTRAEVSLAGPAAGCIAAGACALMWHWTGDGLWAALARAGAWLNLLNLIPVWALDGGQAFSAFSRRQRALLLAGSLLLAISTGEGILVLVALGVLWRLFTRDIPSDPSRSAAAYYLVVLSSLAALVWILPGTGF